MGNKPGGRSLKGGNVPASVDQDPELLRTLQISAAEERKRQKWLRGRPKQAGGAFSDQPALSSVQANAAKPGESLAETQARLERSAALEKRLEKSRAPQVARAKRDRNYEMVIQGKQQQPYTATGGHRLNDSSEVQCSYCGKLFPSASAVQQHVAQAHNTAPACSALPVPVPAPSLSPAPSPSNTASLSVPTTPSAPGVSPSSSPAPVSPAPAQVISSQRPNEAEEGADIPEDEARHSPLSQAINQFVANTPEDLAASMKTLRTILQNILGARTPEERAKFSRIKLASGVVQKNIVRVSGALEILLALGFEVEAVEANEGDQAQSASAGAGNEAFIVFKPDTPTGMLQHALGCLTSMTAQNGAPGS